MSSLDPLVCARCEQRYDLDRRMVTRSCGHSFCEQCTRQHEGCSICPLTSLPVPSVDISTLVCAGCGLHYMKHDKVINQVRILDCGHRSMCHHVKDPVCSICGKRSQRAPVDVSLTAIICRVCIRYPDIIRTQYENKKQQGCWTTLCRACKTRAKKYISL